jgi:MerR family transcriptional regulator/heat shock protein HspR
MAVKKKKSMEPMSKELPLYPIGVAARLLDVHPRTLRIYEDEGLVKPHRQGPRRMFSQNDMQWIACLRSAIHDQGISIPGIRKLLRYATCYEIVECPEQVSCNCDAVIDRVIPRKLRLAGDLQGEEISAEEEREQRKRERMAGGARLKSPRKMEPE